MLHLNAIYAVPSRPPGSCCTEPGTPLTPSPEDTIFRTVTRRLTVGLVVSGMAVTTGSCAPAAVGLRAASPSQIPSLEVEATRDPANQDLLVRLATAYRAAGRYPEARGALERAVRLDPRRGPARFLLALTHEDEESWIAAGGAYSEYAADGDDPSLRSQASRRVPVMRRRALEAEVRGSLAREAELASSPPPPRTVAVFPFLFTGADPDLAPLGRALAELVVTDLAQTDRLRVLERSRVQLLLDEIALGQTGRVDSLTVARSGRILGAGRIVQGTVSGDRSLLLLESAVVPVGDPLATVSPALSEQERLEAFFEAQKRLVLGIYEALGIELTPAERERVNRRPTENVQALLAWGAGLDAEDRGDFLAAAMAYRQATTLDAGFESARRRSQEAEDMAAASGVDTGDLADAAVPVPAGELDDLVFRQLGFEELERILPQIGQRDPVPEVAGTEGLAGRQGILIDLILRRPQ